MSYLEHSVKSVPAGVRKILYLNWPLTVLLIAVASIGFLMLYSVAGGSFTPWAEPQMKRFVLGMVLMIFVAMVPIWFWRNMAVVAYGVSVALLIMVELFGTVGMGAQRWIDLGFMRLQPSELMKITLVMLLAAYYDWLPSFRKSRPFWVLIPVIVILFPTFLVLRQPDLGTAILLLTAGGGLMFVAGVHWAYFAAVVASSIGLITAVFKSRGTDWQLLANYQFRRIDTFIDPINRSAGGRLSYHAIQDRAWLGWLDGARLYAGHAITAELPARKAHRFYLYHTGRRIRLCRGDIFACSVPVDHCVLRLYGPVNERPVFFIIDLGYRFELLPVLCGQYVDGHGAGTGCRCSPSDGQLWRVCHACSYDRLWAGSKRTCPPPSLTPKKESRI